jgi:hypothetical protein
MLRQCRGFLLIELEGRGLRGGSRDQEAYTGVHRFVARASSSRRTLSDQVNVNLQNLAKDKTPTSVEGRF